MSQYTTGTVSVTQGSNEVVGLGTLFLSNIKQGGVFTIVGSTIPYVVGQILDDTHFLLTSNYAGATAAEQSYIVQTSFTPNYNLPYPEQHDIETATIVKRAMLAIDPVLGSAASSSASAAAASALLSAQQAALSAAVAQSASATAGTPSPILMNPNKVTSSMTIPSDYNAFSFGPIEIGDGVTVTLDDNSTWSIQ
ncbi:MAG: hypothetical protein KGL39_11255 [Patescibacteria group bacterium]|nr:hypothetical protein [Patescibacteria group bacterium]